MFEPHIIKETEAVTESIRDTHFLKNNFKLLKVNFMNLYGNNFVKQFGHRI